jgi:hypothetical protein
MKKKYFLDKIGGETSGPLPEERRIRLWRRLFLIFVEGL